METIKKIFLFSVALTLFACNDDDAGQDNTNPSTVTDTEFAQNFGAQVQRDFIGQIVDTENNPIVGATVKIGSSSIQTDAHGVFIINGAGVYERFAYVTATKPGYINGSRSLVPTTGKNNIKIMLLSSVATQVITTGESSTVDLPNATKVVFDGAFADENGNAYSGSVSVSMFHLESSNDNIASLMPGMLYAKSESGQPGGLETFGMLHVELRGSGGQKLQIASGHTAQISMLIDNAQLANAPATIPLWHFDEANGYWKQEGEATREGNKYVGMVSHFSWWNCDTFFSVVMLSATVKNSDGHPLPNVNIKLTRSGGMSGIADTDNNGFTSGLVPANESFTMQVVMDSICGNNQILHSEVIGPFTTDTTLPDIIIDNSLVNFVTVQGNLVKCDNSNVTNGYVTIGYGFGNRSAIAPVTSGSFSFTTAICSGGSPFTLYGVDFDALQETDALTFTYTLPVTNVGNIVACNGVTEFVSYTLDNNPTRYVVGNISAQAYIGIEGPAFVIMSQGPVPIYIFGNEITPGLYTTNGFSIENGDIGYLYSGLTNTMVFNISQVGPVGDFIDMTFYGTYANATGTHTLNGTAHVRREM